MMICRRCVCGCPPSFCSYHANGNLVTADCAKFHIVTALAYNGTMLQTQKERKVVEFHSCCVVENHTPWHECMFWQMEA